MQEVASLPRVEVIPPQFRDFVNGVMLFEIALTVNPLAFEGFGEVYEPKLPAWIHSVVPSTLHQCFKYVDEKGETGYLPTISPFLKESRHTVCTDARLYNDGPDSDG